MSLTVLQSARRLFQHEMLRSWGGIVVTMIFYVYLAVVFGPFLSLLFQAQAQGKPIEWWHWGADFVYLTILPNMAFMMNRTMFHHMKSDSYSRKIAYWRTLPIGISAIVIARMMQLVVVLFLVGIFYFSLQYLVNSSARELMTLGQYLLYMSFWLGYSLAMASTYMYFEQAFSGKIYFTICCLYFVFYGAVLSILWWINIKPVNLSTEWAVQNNWIGAAVMLAIGFMSLFVSGHFVRKRLEKRSILN